MLKNFARKAISLYLSPLKRSERLFYYVRRLFFIDANEHLYSATNFIKKHTAPAPDEIIIDVGGANGGTSVYFANAFPGHGVYCVEPNARMLPYLKEVESKHKRVNVKRLALGSTTAEAVLHVTANDLSSSLNELNLEELKQTPPGFQAAFQEQQQIRVPVSTLDEEFQDSPGVLLIKLDTQGTEIEVLKGGVETLTKTRFILTEMNNHHLYKNACQYYEVDEFLRSRSFKLTDIVVTYRGDEGVTEYDALYRNLSL
ncbi:MAG TPA: FkbM family methyltransferase [Pyrinomonadaceae bacterium]|nr:FkbM family methyltransferase [Pyrinomonadaceae bacterium]